MQALLIMLVFSACGWGSVSTKFTTGTSPTIAYTALKQQAPMNFVELGGGTFQMGSPESEEGAKPWEQPAHLVTVSPFLISETEVTVAQWEAVMGDGASVDRDNGDYPVGEITWCDAISFANRLSLLEGLPAAYTGVQRCPSSRTAGWDEGVAGFRLPTEAEWEYAARAGTTSRFWSGDSEIDLARVGWYDKNAGSVHRVKEKPPNPWGLYDIHGSVWEWVWDGFAPYTSRRERDPVSAPGRDLRHVARGGGYWHGSADGARCASRRVLMEGDRGWDWSRDMGFRLALSASR